MSIHKRLWIFAGHHQHNNKYDDDNIHYHHYMNKYQHLELNQVLWLLANAQPLSFVGGSPTKGANKYCLMDHMIDPFI